MGADGGIGWVVLLDREKWNYLMENMEWRVLNSSAYAYKGECAGPVPDPPDNTNDWLEGAYGTDCEHSLSTLCDLVAIILSPEPLYRFNQEDVKQYTFSELLEDFLTDPFEGYYSDDLKLLKDALSDHHRKYEWAQLPPYIINMKLIDWAKGVNEAIDINSYIDEETWT